MRYLKLGLLNLISALLIAVYITAWFSIFGAIDLQDTTMLIISGVIVLVMTAGTLYFVHNFEINYGDEDDQPEDIYHLNG